MLSLLGSLCLLRDLAFRRFGPPCLDVAPSFISLPSLFKCPLIASQIKNQKFRLFPLKSFLVSYIFTSFRKFSSRPRENKPAPAVQPRVRITPPLTRTKSR